MWYIQGVHIYISYDNVSFFLKGDVDMSTAQKLVSAYIVVIITLMIMYPLATIALVACIVKLTSKVGGIHSTAYFFFI